MGAPPWAGIFRVGAWRSLVAHLHGVQGVGGSNPLAPTKEFNKKAPVGAFLLNAFGHGRREDPSEQAESD